MRLEIIEGLQMMAEMARSNYEDKKAQEQIDKVTNKWNDFFDEWKIINKEIKTELKPEKKKVLPRIGNLIKKS